MTEWDNLPDREKYQIRQAQHDLSGYHERDTVSILIGLISIILIAICGAIYLAIEILEALNG